jgi:hypothetical protein
LTLDINATVLHRFDAVRDLDDLSRDGIGIGKGVRLDELHRIATAISLECSSYPLTLIRSKAFVCHSSAVLAEHLKKRVLTFPSVISIIIGSIIFR